MGLDAKKGVGVRVQRRPGQSCSQGVCVVGFLKRPNFLAFCSSQSKGNSKPAVEPAETGWGGFRFVGVEQNVHMEPGGLLGRKQINAKDGV